MDKFNHSLFPAQKTALMGESGCGKSVLALALFGLLPESAVVSGAVLFHKNCNLLALSEKERKRLMGHHLVLIPQNPTSQLNPTLRVGYQIKESI